MLGVLHLQKNPPSSLDEPIFTFSTDFANIRHRISPSSLFPSHHSLRPRFPQNNGRLRSRQLHSTKRRKKACGGGRDLQPLRPSSLTKPDLLRFRCSSRHALLKRSRCPPCFYISDITNSLSFNGKIFRKKSILAYLS